MCVKELGESSEKGKDNLSGSEKRGLRSLKERVGSGEIIVCQMNKIGRFCVLTRQQYLEHTKNDMKITQEDQEEIN